MSTHEKYLKYKNKYLALLLQVQKGAGPNPPILPGSRKEMIECIISYLRTNNHGIDLSSSVENILNSYTTILKADIMRTNRPHISIRCGHRLLYLKTLYPQYAQYLVGSFTPDYPETFVDIYDADPGRDYAALLRM
jgi:hypothetical protein